MVFDVVLVQMQLLTSHLVRNWFTLCSGCYLKQWFSLSLSLSHSLSLQYFVIIDLCSYLFPFLNLKLATLLLGRRWLCKVDLNDYISTVLLSLSLSLSQYIYIYTHIYISTVAADWTAWSSMASLILSHQFQVANAIECDPCSCRW